MLGKIETELFKKDKIKFPELSKGQDKATK